MENFDFKKYLAEGKLLKENTLKNDIKDFIDSIDIDNYQRSKDNDPDFENVDFDMEFFLDMYPEYAGKEEEIQQILNNKENLAEEWKQFGRSNYKIELNDAGDRVVNLFSGEEILVQKKGEKQRTDDEITNDIEKTYKPSDGKAEIDREIDDLIKYGKFGQTRREFRPSDEPRYRKR